MEETCKNETSDDVTSYLKELITLFESKSKVFEEKSDNIASSLNGIKAVNVGGSFPKGSEEVPSPLAKMQPIIFMMPPENNGLLPYSNATYTPGVSNFSSVPNIIINNMTDKATGSGTTQPVLSGSGSSTMSSEATPAAITSETDKPASETINPLGQQAAAMASTMAMNGNNLLTTRAEDVVNKRVVSMLRQFHKGLNGFIMNASA